MEKIPGRIMCLDVGDRWVGVAVSDQTRLISQGAGRVERVASGKDLDDIRAIAAEWEANEILVGLPIRTDGTIGTQAEKVREYAKRVAQATGLPVTEWDERFSTAAVERTMIEGGVRREKRRQLIDSLAAVYILQGYLDSIPRGEPVGEPE